MSENLKNSELRKLKKSIANKKYYEKKKEMTEIEPNNKVFERSTHTAEGVFESLIQPDGNEIKKEDSEFVELDETQLNELLTKIKDQKNVQTAPSIWGQVKAQVIGSLILGAIPVIPRLIPLILGMTQKAYVRPINTSSETPSINYQTYTDPFQGLQL